MLYSKAIPNSKFQICRVRVRGHLSHATDLLFELRCRRTVDYTGPYMRLIQERLKQPDRYGIRLLQPTAAGALKVVLENDSHMHFMPDPASMS